MGLRSKDEAADTRVSISCCDHNFELSDPESALRQLAYHAEKEHGIPREAAANWLLADAKVREVDHAE